MTKKGHQKFLALKWMDIFA